MRSSDRGQRWVPCCISENIISRYRITVSRFHKLSPRSKDLNATSRADLSASNWPLPRIHAPSVEAHAPTQRTRVSPSAPAFSISARTFCLSRARPPLDTILDTSPPSLRLHPPAFPCCRPGPHAHPPAPADQPNRTRTTTAAGTATPRRTNFAAARLLTL